MVNTRSLRLCVVSQCLYIAIYYCITEPSGSPEVTVIDATSDTIHLHIIPPPDQDQNGIITGYIIEYFSSRETESILIEIDSTQYMLEAVPYTNYTLRVTSLNSAGQGPFSEYLLVETLQDGTCLYFVIYTNITILIYTQHHRMNQYCL